MTTRIEAGGPSPGVVSGPTAARVTPPPAQPFHQMMREGARSVVQGAEDAVRRLPGGPILAAAFRSPGDGAAGGGAVSGGGVPERAEGPTGTGQGGGGRPSLEDSLAANVDRNLYYLELQERISAENRAYTAVSNVLKARHDTVKNAIGNIR